MAAVIQKSPVGAKLAYYLGTHREEAAAIAKLTDPLDVAVAMGEVKARIAGQKSEPVQEATPEPVVSKAPKPPTPVSKAASGPKPFDPNDASLSADEWARRRNAQLRERR
jgi:hypothetical protein